LLVEAARPEERDAKRGKSGNTDNNDGGANEGRSKQ
jgi:hypothetical protein